MFYIEIIDNEIKEYTKNKNVANKFYANYIESEEEPKRGFDGKLYLKEIPNEVLKNEKKHKVISNIEALECQITPRRMREAFAKNKDALAFIADIESQIEVLRKQL